MFVSRTLVAVLASVILSAAAYACTCLPSPPPKEALEKSAAVFSGKVTKIEDVGEFQIAVTIEVAKTWKGIEDKEVVVTTANQSAACGYEFEKGKSYLIYAQETKKGDAKRLSTGLCTRTSLLDEAKEDLKELGEGKSVR